MRHPEAIKSTFGQGSTFFQRKESIEDSGIPPALGTDTQIAQGNQYFDEACMAEVYRLKSCHLWPHGTWLLCLVDTSKYPYNSQYSTKSIQPNTQADAGGQPSGRQQLNTTNSHTRREYSWVPGLRFGFSYHRLAINKSPSLVKTNTREKHRCLNAVLVTPLGAHSIHKPSCFDPLTLCLDIQYNSKGACA